MFARGLAERLRIRGKLVPEAVKIDAFTSGDQPLHIGAAEAEMPQEWALEYFLPRSDPGQRCVHQDEPGYPVRVLGGERVSDHVADVVRDEVRPFNPERVENASHIPALCLLVVSTGGTNREPHATQVGNDIVWSRARSAAKDAHMSPVSP